MIPLPPNMLPFVEAAKDPEAAPWVLGCLALLSVFFVLFAVFLALKEVQEWVNRRKAKRFQGTIRVHQKNEPRKH